MEGVATLRQDACLSAIAAQRAQDMVARNYFAHETPDGRMPWDFMRADGCGFAYAGENIAEAQDEREAVYALWNSAEHRRNTLDVHYAHVGVGAAVRSDGTIVFVEEFTGE